MSFVLTSIYGEHENFGKVVDYPPPKPYSFRLHINSLATGDTEWRPGSRSIMVQFDYTDLFSDISKIKFDATH